MSSRKPLYQMSLAEQAALVQPVDRALQADKLTKGLYNIYQSGEDKTVLILDYADKTEQVRVNTVTGQTRTIRRRIK
jgi:hypothetical protein